MVKALTVGMTGENGSCFTERLYRKSFEVHAIIIRGYSSNIDRIDHLSNTNEFKNKSFFTYYGDLVELSNSNQPLKFNQPAGVCN